MSERASDFRDRSNVLRISGELRLDEAPTPDLRSFQKQASAAVLRPAALREPPEPENPFWEPNEARWTPEATHLTLEGWEYITRNGVRIWRDTSENPMGYGSWNSEETAYGWISEANEGGSE